MMTRKTVSDSGVFGPQIHNFHTTGPDYPLGPPLSAVTAPPTGKCGTLTRQHVRLIKNHFDI